MEVNFNMQAGISGGNRVVCHRRITVSGVQIVKHSNRGIPVANKTDGESGPGCQVEVRSMRFRLAI